MQFDWIKLKVRLDRQGLWFLNMLFFFRFGLTKNAYEDSHICYRFSCQKVTALQSCRRDVDQFQQCNFFGIYCQ